ncbi:hypothetical protein G210_1953 [Candida maltosa Xu316]|uniref:Peptidase A1 domain-containing protein n=1 Tax=Candida maltosa (strain Xu316) TaxID=1245528 RepID=M3JXH1_CANMX|nr:hypothetical protein G210_1953 [Candida maltosa Xu316]
MRTNLLCSLLLVASLISAEDPITPTPTTDSSDSDTSSTPAIVVAPNTDTARQTTTTSNRTPTTDDLVQVTLQRQTSTQSSSSRSNSAITPSSAPRSKTTENEQDKALLKLLFTIPPDDNFYNADFKFGSQDQDIQLRLDLVQPEIWVMNQANFMDCDSIDTWIASELSEMHLTASTDSLPAAITTNSEYTANCGYYGLYTSSEGSDVAQPTSGVAVSNNQPYLVPYMNSIYAFGTFVTDSITFNLTDGDYFKMSSMTFLDVNDTNVYAGGLGVALDSKGSGFLPTLVENQIIKSPGYSLWFNNYSDPDHAIAQLILGAVNTKYYIGDLYQFDIIPHRGYRYNASQQATNQDLIELTLPIVLVKDVLVMNLNTGESLSMKSSSSDIPVLLDSRTSYFYLPLDLIINLAIQTNAYYSGEVGRWLVKCQPLIDAAARINIVIGNLTIPIPLTELIADAVYQGVPLAFEGGDKACFLKVVPNSVSGYTCLGLPFLKYAYLVVDNEGGTIGLANSNKYLQVNKSDYAILGGDSQSNITRSGNATTPGEVKSIGHITSGYIPFATILNNGTSPSATFTYSSVTTTSGESVILDIPARFSGAVISNGYIYITGEASNSASLSTSALNASAADARSTGYAARYQQEVIATIGSVKIQTQMLAVVLSVILGLVTLM